MNKKTIHRIVYGFILWGWVLTSGILSSCQDEMLADIHSPIAIEEGIPGTLSLTLAARASEEREVSTRNSEQESSEQHLHSAYLFVIDKKTGVPPAQCPILARKYFPDILSNLVAIKEGENILHVSQLQLPAVSCQSAQVFAIINLGYSDLQGVRNDAALLKSCDQAANLADLMKLSAQLSEKETDEIVMDRMQGHYLMSGFLGAAADERHYLHEAPTFAFQSDGKGGLAIYNSNNELMRPLGTTTQIKGEPCAVYVHRLDAKISFRIVPDGALKTTPGAYFRLESWQVLNVPSSSHLYWQKQSNYQGHQSSKIYKRDLSQGEDGSWKFTFYQFENAATTDFSTLPTSGKYITATSIADQYNKEYNLKEKKVLPSDVSNSFSQYPNMYSDFAYGLRELQKKNKGENGEYGEYVPNDPSNIDQMVIVKNGDYEYAPANATYVRLIGRYYNPQEPSKRMADDPRSIQYEQTYPIAKYPYWGPGQQPVQTKEEALKRTRSATVVYHVHLGYVGGGNFLMNEEPIPPSIAHEEPTKRLDAYQKKVNDYNVLRNHHYIYTLKVAGVENIKLEATRENQGNILEQEKQPGAEGSILESQHFYNLDAHYETRNVTIDFTRFPENYSKAFSFSISTPFDRLFMTLKQQGDSDNFVFVDRFGRPIESIRNHDWDWIHFAWHGTPEDPYRSMIDPKTGNGIPYSQTYGGYEHQQTYRDIFLTQNKDSEHTHRLLNSMEFAELVWRLYVKWIEKGKDPVKKDVTFTMYVDENYYDYNPTNNEQVSWWHFCNQPKRKALFFMEPDEISADLNSWYADAHLAVYQSSIQTLYATDNKQGQVVANVAFGIEALDEFRAKYAKDSHPFTDTESSLNNGLYNIMRWYQKNRNRADEVIPWEKAESYFNDKCRAIVPDRQGNTESQPGGGDRQLRNPKWAIYSRNRDLNRNGQLDPFEVRWFVPAAEQYTLCFLGGRPVFENPLFEKDKAVKPGTESDEWIRGVPLIHYISSSSPKHNQIFWAEEGCSMGNYNLGHVSHLYGIRMARMLCSHGVENNGAAFGDNPNAKSLQHDEIFTVSQSPDGVPVDYNQRVDGKPYYILLNKMNINAFRDRVRIGELAQHTHEQKENWLFREYRIARHKVGYTSYESPLDYNRTIKVDGEPRTWWQVNGVWTKNWSTESIYYYQGEEYSLAYMYSEEADGSDLHHWRMPNLREVAIMSMVFPESWFQGPITCGTTSENLGPHSTNIPFWHVQSNKIGRLVKNARDRFYVRPIQDVP